MRTLIIVLTLILVSLSIYAQESSIQIISIDTASQGMVKVVVKNTGVELDTVTVYGTCQDNRFRVYGNTEVSIQPGQSVTASLPISTGVGTKTSTTCTIYAEGVVYSDSKQFTATGDVPGKECTTGSLVCDTDGNINQCSNDGTWTHHQTCGSGCSYDKEGIPHCDIKKSSKSGLIITTVISLFILVFIVYLLRKKNTKS